MKSWMFSSFLVTATALSLQADALAGPHALPKLPDAVVKKIEDATPAKATRKPKKERRLLVLWRCDGFFHGGGIAGANIALEQMSKKTKAFTADFTDELTVFTPENLAKYDAVVLNNTTSLKMTAEQQKALIDFVRNGKGLVGIHGASDNFYEWPEGAAMVGGLFDGHPWNAGRTWAIKVDEPKHPLTKAFDGKGFKIMDEIYQFKDPYTRADRRVLLSLDLSDPTTGGIGGKRADKDYAVAWIKNEGKGRVFYSSLGHDANVFELADIQAFLLDGIQFATGDLKADASPVK